MPVEIERKTRGERDEAAGMQLRALLDDPSTSNAFHAAYLVANDIRYQFTPTTDVIPGRDELTPEERLLLAVFGPGGGREGEDFVLELSRAFEHMLAVAIPSSPTIAAAVTAAAQAHRDALAASEDEDEYPPAALRPALAAIVLLLARDLRA